MFVFLFIYLYVVSIKAVTFVTFLTVLGKFTSKLIEIRNYIMKIVNEIIVDNFKLW